MRPTLELKLGTANANAWVHLWIASALHFSCNYFSRVKNAVKTKLKT